MRYKVEMILSSNYEIKKTEIEGYNYDIMLKL